MFRKINQIVVMVFVLGLVGCRACYSPYETCQPTFNPQRGDHCMGELYRAGSIMGGAERTKNDGECQSCSTGGSSSLLEFNDKTVTQTGADNLPPLQVENGDSNTAVVNNSVVGNNGNNGNNANNFVPGPETGNDPMMNQFTVQGTVGEEFNVGKPATEELPPAILQKRPK